MSSDYLRISYLMFCMFVVYLQMRKMDGKMWVVKSFALLRVHVWDKKNTHTPFDIFNLKLILYYAKWTDDWFWVSRLPLL